MKKLTKEEFIRKSVIVHGNKYDYTDSEYVSGRIKTTITCHEHGKFIQEPRGHLLGYGCPQCGYIERPNNRTITTSEFINRANTIHNKYDYTASIFTGMHKKVKIKCPEHGSFNQIAGGHLKGQGCPACSCNNISRAETKWLDILGVSIRQEKLTLNDSSIIKVDGYNPITNTVYEFWGDYWHGNPKRFSGADINKHNKISFGELYNLTQIKRQKILSNGYNLTEIWESDFI